MRVPVPRVLVVDDDAQIRELLESTLRFAGWEVHAVPDAATALVRLTGQEFDVVVLDVMMPGLDGFETVRLLRGRGKTTPVLFLTARQEVEDRIQGLRLGADDYVTKPFSVAEVVARLEALVRRTAGTDVPSKDNRLLLADLAVDLDAHLVTRAGRPVHLSPTEFRLLVFLLNNAGRVLSKSQILQHVWGYDFGGDANVVERFVANLRRKIDDGASVPLIHTVRGFGYAVREPR
ncbi:response regulator transcription factor [Solwaraspora sp. WMMA2056]|uniref:response regulator transcription factor n=1 Tax=Solwaraspora sp. WMMA2056 TaxID=3015161 RepID=UPI00259BE848|nr:response regulator transcription factor [Solwaraspora sp. WMMA2056]WJK44060.1 response regulator transcription factor [Solwaraspora sp. WMMA2056]